MAEESLGFKAVRVVMEWRGWYVDGTREVLAADHGAVRAIYVPEHGTWRIECGNPWSAEGSVLTITVERDWTVGAVRSLMEHMRLLADVTQKETSR